ncbi:MAG: hypothetical protein P4L59_21550 [Desulfosporosinus sp.]|nr:hypothetical protein [Desulfosporosinus sp.]
MPYLTTGLIDNTTVESVRQSSRLSVEIANEDTSTVAIQIEGFLLSGTTKVKYVDEFFTLAAGTVDLRNYYVHFDAYEFQFFVSSQFVHVSAWGKNGVGKITSAYQVVIEEVGRFI